MRRRDGLMSACRLVERLGSHVELLLGPHDRAVFDGDARKPAWVSQRLKDPMPFPVSEGDISDGAVLK